MIAAGAIKPSIALLNSTTVFDGRVKFTSFSRRGSMIVGKMANGRKVIWHTMADLLNFSRSTAAIAEGSNVVLTKPPGLVSEFWTPVADMILKLASKDMKVDRDPLEQECRELLQHMWFRSRSTHVQDSREFMRCMDEIQKAIRNRDPEPPPCVFLAETFCWVHLHTLRQWLSTPQFMNYRYDYAAVRNGLYLLGFEYIEDVTRGFEGEASSLCLWRGPEDTLVKG
jgi:hypothetical protein